MGDGGETLRWYSSICLQPLTMLTIKFWLNVSRLSESRGRTLCFWNPFYQIDCRWLLWTFFCHNLSPWLAGFHKALLSAPFSLTFMVNPWLPLSDLSGWTLHPILSPSANSQAASNFCDYTTAIGNWMNVNCLRLNSAKTEVAPFGNLPSLWSPPCWPTELGPLPTPVWKARNLDLIMNNKQHWSSGLFMSLWCLKMFSLSSSPCPKNCFHRTYSF